MGQMKTKTYAHRGTDERTEQSELDMQHMHVGSKSSASPVYAISVQFKNHIRITERTNERTNGMRDATACCVMRHRGASGSTAWNADALSAGMSE